MTKGEDGHICVTSFIKGPKTEFKYTKKTKHDKIQNEEIFW